LKQQSALSLCHLKIILTPETPFGLTPETNVKPNYGYCCEKQYSSGMASYLLTPQGFTIKLVDSN